MGKIVFYLPDTDTWYELPKSPSKLDDVLASNGDKVYYMKLSPNLPVILLNGMTYS